MWRSGTPICTDTLILTVILICSDTPICSWNPITSDSPVLSNTPACSDTLICSDTSFCSDPQFCSDSPICSEVLFFLFPTLLYLGKPSKKNPKKFGNFPNFPDPTPQKFGNFPNFRVFFLISQKSHQYVLIHPELQKNQTKFCCCTVQFCTVRYYTVQVTTHPHPTHTQKWFFFFAFPGHFQNFPKTFRKKPKTSKKKFGFLGFFWRLPLWVNDQISAQISLELDSLELHSCLNNNLNAPPPPQQLTCCQQAKWIRSHMTSPSQLKVSPLSSCAALFIP